MNNLLHIELVTAKNGLPALLVHLADGKSIYINSAYDPVREAERWASQVEVKPSDLVILFGLGLGYHLKELMKKITPGVQVFVIEPSPYVMRLAREQEICRQALSHPDVFLVENWTAFKAVYQDYGSRWRNLRFTKIPCYTRMYPEDYQEIIKRVSRELNSLLVDRCTVLKSAQVWQTNLLKNLRFLTEISPISSVFDRFRNRPAIIVAAGPSLDKNVDLLHQAKGRALILATGTVVRLLEKRGIEPDLILSFDGNERNFLAHFNGIEMHQPVLVFDPAIHYQIVENYQGPRSMMVINEANLWLEEFLDQPIGMVKSGPSIANTAFALAYKLGADPVILIGQDLAYTGGRTHAPDTHLEQYIYEVPKNWLEGKPVRETDASRPEFKEHSHYWSRAKAIWIDGVDGEKVPTDRKMLSFLHWFEEIIENLERKATIIDATEGGALIRGTEVMSLQEALNRYCSDDLSGEIQAVRETLCRPFDTGILELISFLKESCNVVERLISQCAKGARLSKVLFEHYENGRECNVGKILSRLESVDRFLQKSKRFYRPFHYVIHPVLGIHANSNLDDRSPETDIARQSLLLYRDLKSSLSKALPLLGGVIRSLEKHRCAEKSSRPKAVRQAL